MKSKNIFKKIIAVLLVLCIAVSACVISVSAQDTEGAVKASLGKGLGWFGYSLTVIANSTDDDEFKENAAAINSWLCGGSNVSFKLSEISAMCNQLLAEVETVNTQNKEIISSVAKLGLSTDYKAMDEVYTNQVTDIISKYGFTSAVANYEEYVEAVRVYQENKTPENKEAAEFAKKMFLTSVVGNNEESEYTNCTIGGVNNWDVSVDSCFYNCLSDLTAMLVTNTLISGNRFVDSAAQLAYKMYPYSSMQYDFVMYAVKKQLLEITKIMLMYQEFTGMRAEYFQGISNGSIKTSIPYTDAQLDDIYERSNEHLSDVLNIVSKRVSSWLNGPVYINENGCWLYLSQYMTSDDAQTQTLTITNYRNSTDYNFYLRESAKGRVETSIAINLRINPEKGMANNADISKELKFHKEASIIPGAGNSGQAQVMPFYILEGESLEEGQTKCKAFDHNVVNYSGLYDLHLPKTDYYNMVQGVYSDGYKNFRCISNEEQLHQIINTDYYNLCGSSVKNYFSDKLGYAEDNNVYFMLNSATSPSAQGAPTDYTVLPALDSSAEHTISKTWSNSSIDLYNVQSDRKGSANKSSSEYAILLLPENNDFKGKVEVFGERTDCFVSGADYDPATGLATSGQNVDIKIYPHERMEISSVTLEVGSAKNTISVNELTVDEDGGFVLSYAVPYSNNLTVTVNTTPEELDKNSEGCYVVEDFDDLCSVAYMVNSGLEEYVNGSYVLTDDIDCMGEDFSKREMIGTADIQFCGEFNGMNHTISNLNNGADIEGKDSGKTQGLFGVIGIDATVKNLNVTGASVWSDDSIIQGSAVIAKQNNGRIENCHVRSSKVQLGNSDYLGGITGINNGVIKGCSVENTTLMRRWGGCLKRAMGNICEVNEGQIIDCSAINCTFKNGSITDSSLLCAVDNGL